MLAAIVEEDQVALWSVVPGTDPPHPAMPAPNDPVLHPVDELPASPAEPEWGIVPPLRAPSPEEAAAAEDLFEQLAAGPLEEPAYDVPPLPTPPEPRAEPTAELELEASPVVNAESLPEASGPLPEPSVAPVEPIAPLPEPDRLDGAGARAADVLEAMARRVRNGEIVLPHGPSLGSDAAVLAAVLTALLKGRD